MTKEMWAQLLNGRSMGEEISHAEERAAAADGVLIVFGYSDDNMELRGLINDEVGCFDGGRFLLHRAGILPTEHEQCECQFCGYAAAAAQCVKIEAVWGDSACPWTYKTDMPHAAFEIKDDAGKPFCRGIVIDGASLPVLKGYKP